MGAEWDPAYAAPVKVVTCILILCAAACGPSGGSERDCGSGPTDLETDPMNCGQCMLACGENMTCRGGVCNDGVCDPGTTDTCYDGQDGTAGVGPCVKGTHTCDATGQWGICMGEVVPHAEICGNGIDDNCNGKVDEDEDADGDGFTTCQGDCCDSTECSNPADVNPGAFDAPGNGVDDDCDGIIDNSITVCDQTLASDSTDAMDFAKAIDLCQVATAADKKWGVLSGSLTLPSGTGTPDAVSHSIRHHFGTGVQPQGGLSLAMISSGTAAGIGDMNPAHQDFVSYEGTQSSPLPADWIAANGGKVPNAPGCPEPDGGAVGNDPVMITLNIRVPTNAHSFKLSVNFFSAEFPEYVCTPYNDFFVVLLDSTYAGTPANPADKNLAFYSPPGMSGLTFPVGVNLADTGLFTQCVNGATGCAGSPAPGNITSCTGVTQLAQTGMDEADAGCGAPGSTTGGGSGWLVTSGNVMPGETMKLRIAIWDTSDHLYDSLAVIDGFQWSVDSTQPGTVIFDRPPGLTPFNPLVPQAAR